LPTDNRTLERPILKRFLDVAREIGQDLKRQVSERFIGPLDRLPRVTLRHAHAEIIAHSFPRRHLALDRVLLLGCALRICIQMSDQARQVRIMGKGFEAELVLERDSEGEDEVNGCDFREEVVFGVFRAFADVDPDVAGQVSGLDGEGGPRFAAVGVTV